VVLVLYLWCKADVFDRKETLMQTIHVKANERMVARILDFINTLSKEGEEIEILDSKILAFEKYYIDRSLQDIEEGKVYPIEEVEEELLNEN
jgi:predicted metallo-beta-lactamase superfamily hydrolase